MIIINHSLTHSPTHSLLPSLSLFPLHFPALKKKKKDMSAAIDERTSIGIRESKVQELSSTSSSLILKSKNKATENKKWVWDPSTDGTFCYI